MTGRPAHLHYIVKAPGMSSITTEVFFENAEYIDNDAVFGVRKSLIAKVAPAKDVDSLGYALEKKPDAVCEFNFVLAPEG